MDQASKDTLAKNLGISKENQAILDEADKHRYDCRCDICKKWWQLMGPEPGTDSYGPFTKEEIEGNASNVK